MNLISFLVEKFKKNFSAGLEIPTLNFRWITLLVLFGLLPWQKIVSLDHLCPVMPTATLSSDQTHVSISWEKTGTVWTEGSQFIICKTNLTTSSFYEIPLTKAELESLSYEDNVKPCNTYSYKLIMKPGDGSSVSSLPIDGEFSPSGCEQNHVYLTIQDGVKGKMDMLVGSCRFYKFRFVPEEDWVVNSVSFNGKDVTSKLRNGIYQTPELLDNSTLSVVYKKKDLTNVMSPSNSLSSVWVKGGEVVICNAPMESKVSVTTITGDVVYRGRVDSSEMVLGSLGSGVFIVNVNGEIFKVSL
ncbi:MAG: hypothetical protein IK005_07645 [Paludibacteraceae bacterium]|nr:hypothetical protein [Paludibacteraceae bacterium]